MRFATMKLLLGMILTVACAALTVPPVRAESVSGQKIDAALVTQICSNQALPDGYVVVSSAVDTYNCPGSNVYRLTISPPSNNISACFGSGYPAPYFITAITTNGVINCAGYQYVMVLQQPRNSLAVCANGVIWSPWVITAVAQQGGSCSGYGTIVISQPSEGLAICSNSPIPAGWTATGGSASITCQPYLLQNLHRTSVARVATETPSGVYVRSGDSATFVPGDEAR
ncbi:hypothetical protein [Luteibacter sp. 9133]|uniref:hypothetical protein n=1 Tax=Luteibacter sp. 9133 TaxID=1500891 RepID=UPI0012DFF459|nr:hypothetical protein [Luteibacter sp. 9133]